MWNWISRTMWGWELKRPAHRDINRCHSECVIERYGNFWSVLSRFVTTTNCGIDCASYLLRFFSVLHSFFMDLRVIHSSVVVFNPKSNFWPFFLPIVGRLWVDCATYYPRKPMFLRIWLQSSLFCLTCSQAFMTNGPFLFFRSLVPKLCQIFEDFSLVRQT